MTTFTWILIALMLAGIFISYKIGKKRGIKLSTTLAPTVAAPAWQFQDAWIIAMTLDELKFTYTQAVKLMDDTIAGSNIVGTKCTTLLGVMTILVSTIIGFNVTRLVAKPELDYVTIASAICCIYLAFPIVKLYKGNVATEYYCAGFKPSEVIRDELFAPPPVGQTFNEDFTREMNMYVHHINSIEVGIKTNEDINEIRFRYYNSALRYFVNSPIFFFLIFFLAFIVSNWKII